MPVIPVVRPVLRLPVERIVPIGQVDPALPRDPALRSAANDLIAKVKYAACVAASETEHAAPGQLDAALNEFFASRRPAAQARAATKARALLTSSDAHRSMEFGRYADVAVRDYLKVGSDRVPKGLIDLHIDSAALQKGFDALGFHLIKQVPPSIVLKPPSTDPDLKAGLAFTKLRLFIRGVRCVEETDEIGADHINLGAVKATPQGDTSIVDQFTVSDDFDEGEKVSYPGLGHKLTGWNIVTDEPWPKVYGVVLAMAEKDDGGFYKFLQELWEYVKEEVTALIAAGVGAAIGGAMGGVLGAVIGAIVGGIIGFFINLFDNEDDIVGAKKLTMTLVTATKSYYDWAQLTSAEGYKMDLHYKGDGGHYRVGVAWKVFTE